MRYKRGSAPQPKMNNLLTKYALGLKRLGEIMPSPAFSRMISGLVKGELTLPEKVAFVNMMIVAYDD